MSGRGIGVPFSIETSGPFGVNAKEMWNSIAEFNAYPRELKYDGMPIWIKPSSPEKGHYQYDATLDALVPVSASAIDPTSIHIRDTQIIYKSGAFDCSVSAGAAVFKLGLAQNRQAVLTGNRPPDAVTIETEAQTIQAGQTTYSKTIPTFGRNRTDNGSWNNLEFSRSIAFTASESAKDITNGQGTITNYTPAATVNKSLTIYGVYPFYFGKLVNRDINDFITALTAAGGNATFSELIERKGNKDVTFADAGNKYLFFAYPSAYGDLTQVLSFALSSSGMDVLVSSVAQTGFKLEAPFSLTMPDGQPVEYLPYIYTVKLATGSPNFRFAF